MQEINFDPQTEEEKAQLAEFIETHSVFEVFVKLHPPINNYIQNIYHLRRLKISAELELFPGKESKIKHIERELDLLAEIRESDFIRKWFSLFDSTLPILHLINDSYQAYLASGIRLVQKDFDQMKEFEKDLIPYTIAIANGEDPELSEPQMNALIRELPDEIKRLFNDPENFNTRFFDVTLELYHRRLYVKDLVKYLEQSEITDYTSDFKIRWNVNPTDVVRLLVAAYDSKVFRAEEGEILSIEMIMDEFGRLFELDLGNHSNLLSNGLNNSLQANLRMIEKMKKSISKRHKNKN